jgi:hypothetical protein
LCFGGHGRKIESIGCVSQDEMHFQIFDLQRPLVGRTLGHRDVRPSSLLVFGTFSLGPKFQRNIQFCVPNVFRNGTLLTRIPTYVLWSLAKRILPKPTKWAKTYAFFVKIRKLPRLSGQNGNFPNI